MATLLACEPSEIVFAVDPAKKTLQTYVTVRNTSDTAHVAFSVKTTQPAKYAVRPPQGVIPPRQSVSVTVLMSNRKPPAAMGVQKTDKFLFQFGEVPPGTSDEAAKDALRGSEGPTGSNGLKLKVRLKDMPRAPSTINESINEGHPSFADEPGTPSSKGGQVAGFRNGSDFPQAPGLTSPMSRRAEEASELREELGRLRKEREELQQSTAQLRSYSGNAASASAGAPGAVSGKKGRGSTADRIASARAGEGFGLLHLLATLLFAVFLGIASKFVGKELLVKVAIQLKRQLSP